MISPKDRKIVRRLKRKLMQITSIQRMVVYGSRARGDAVEDSDLDIFIELQDLTPELQREIREIA